MIDRKSEFKEIIAEANNPKVDTDLILSLMVYVYNIAIDDATKSAYAKQEIKGPIVTAYVDKSSILKLKLKLT